MPKIYFMSQTKSISVFQKDYRRVITPKLRIGIVAADFNGAITERLLEGALGFLHSVGLRSEQIVLCRVPGALEIPLMCADLCHSKKAHGIVALGAVILGKTFHFEVVCLESARGVMDVSLRYRIPIGNSILTCNTEKQAFDRSGGREGNKGWDVARTVFDVLKARKTLVENRGLHP
jgi:6,7-dimethyl-8-ribityllumazine synthase